MSFFEEQLILHASPVISNIKASNMFSIPIEQASVVRDDFCMYCKLLSKKGLKMRFLYCKGRKVNVFIYNSQKLSEILSNKRIQIFLEKYGYPCKSSLEDMVNFLRKRIYSQSDFPHEIGFFLGYPTEDVFQFICKNGKNYKMCGCWKVYSDEQGAVHMFEAYEKIRTIFLSMAKSGIPVKKIISAA